MASQIFDHLKTLSPLMQVLGFVGFATVCLAVGSAALADWTARPVTVFRKKALEDWADR